MIQLIWRNVMVKQSIQIKPIEYKAKQVHLMTHAVMNNELVEHFKADLYLIDIKEDFISIVHKTTQHRILVPMSNIRNIELA